MNVEQLLTLPLAETLTVDGKAPNTVGAHNMAHDALAAACAPLDPVEAWTLKAIQHAYDPETGGVVFRAEFLRNPNFEQE